uniref:Uncharacterized protein n=1 Tax=Rhizophora mucronata TaxID=61149 RepID=A0A2P2Q3G8_RHIMU
MKPTMERQALFHSHWTINCFIY